MPERRRQPRLILRAAITLDGRLDGGAPVEAVRGTVIEPLDMDRARALLVAREVGEIHLIVRPRIDGRRDSPTLSGAVTPEFFPQSLACRLLRMETRDGECFLHYRVLRRSSG